jgi:mRNA-degrading endonuclease RelE of RelBE toxin-antitoxin system
LVWYKKVYVNNKKIRIIYKVIDEKIEVLVIAIWKRENKKVYDDALKRI